MTTITRQGSKIDLELIAGSTFNWYIAIKEGELPVNYNQADLDALTPVAVDAHEITCTINPKGCDATGNQLQPFELTTTNGGVSVDPMEVGIIRLKILSSVSELFEWTSASYAINVITSQDDKFIPAYGQITVFNPT